MSRNQIRDVLGALLYGTTRPEPSLQDRVRAFLDAYDAADPYVFAIYQIAAAHGFVYQGPTYERELEALRAALRPRKEGE